MLTIRQFGAIFFLLYGLLIPILSPAFVAENTVASLAMIASCCVISLLLYSGRALLFNILIAVYVFQYYLIRPYINIFLDKLEPHQLAYILENSSYFYPDRAAVVYLSLLSLLVAWFFGLLVTKPKKHTKSTPWIFQQLDTIVFSLNWRLWLVLIFLSLITYQNPIDSWNSIIGYAPGEGGGTPLFALGLFGTSTLKYVFLAAFLILRKQVSGKIYYILLIPILIDSVFAVAGGGRGALWNIFIFTLTFWIFLNANRHITYVDIKRVFWVVLFLPFVILSGLVAQVLKPFLRMGVDPDVLLNVLFSNLNIFNPNNPLLTTLYFGVTELLHRLSHLQEKFLVLNDVYIHPPWATFNPWHSFKRIINDIVPGTLFPEVININRLFHHIYFDEYVHYASHMWGLQSTLYLYFGFPFSPIVVFFIAMVVGRHYSKIQYWASTSPALATLFIFIINDLITNGTLERVIPVDIVRPLVSFVATILLVKFLYILFPTKNTRQLNN